MEKTTISCLLGFGSYFYAKRRLQKIDGELRIVRLGVFAKDFVEISFVFE